MSPALWGFVGTLVGALAALGATYLQQSHASKREREASERESAEKRRVFQRDVILELQEVLARLVRFHGSMHFHNEMEWRRSGEWGRAPLPEDVDAGVLSEAVRVIMLAERIDDDDLRELLRAFTDRLAWMSVLTDRDVAQNEFNTLQVDYPSIQRQVGAVFRAL